MAKLSPKCTVLTGHSNPSVTQPYGAVIFAGNGKHYSHAPFVDTIRATLTDDRAWLRRRNVDSSSLARFNRSLRPSSRVFPKNCVIEKHVNDKNSSAIGYDYRKCFFDLLLDIKTGCAPFSRLAELHVITHSWGMGLYLGYHDPGTSAHRGDVANKMKAKIAPYTSKGSPIPDAVKADVYDLGRDEEIGAIFADHLILPDEKLLRLRVDPESQKLRKKLHGLFAPDGFIKLWGCNALGYGEFEDDDMPWGAFSWFNEINPSVGQAMAHFFGVKVIAADRGSNIQTWQHTKSGWEWSEKNYQYNRAHRLDPEGGATYRTVHPRPSAKKSSGSV